MVGRVFFSTNKKITLKSSDHQALSFGPFEFTDHRPSILKWNGPRFDPLRGDFSEKIETEFVISKWRP